MKQIMGITNVLCRAYSKKVKTLSGDAKATYLALIYFEFIFILHLIKQIMGTTNVLCRACNNKMKTLSMA